MATIAVFHQLEGIKTMNANPCLDCSMKDQDKNNERCLHCKKRVQYVEELAIQLNFSASYADDSYSAGLYALPRGGAQLL
jgi:hypothetical protein